MLTKPCWLQQRPAYTSRLQAQEGIARPNLTLEKLFFAKSMAESGCQVSGRPCACTYDFSPQRVWEAAHLHLQHWVLDRHRVAVTVAFHCGERRTSVRGWRPEHHLKGIEAKDGRAGSWTVLLAPPGRQVCGRRRVDAKLVPARATLSGSSRRGPGMHAGLRSCCSKGSWRHCTRHKS